MNMADPATLIASWITPSSLFILVNLVIGTIAITSRFTAQKPQNHQQPGQLHRSPSLLDRVRSFNLRHYEPTQPEPEPEPESAQHQLVRTPSLLLERVTSFKFSLFQSQPALAVAETERVQPESSQPDPDVPQLVRPPSVLERVRSMSFSRLYRSESMHQEGVDPGPEPGHVEMKKSASERVVSCEREEEEGVVERRRPATAIGKGETTSWGEDEEVDARADDFINRFKKQLKLQRMDSILRYREMLRGN